MTISAHLAFLVKAGPNVEEGSDDFPIRPLGPVLGDALTTVGIPVLEAASPTPARPVPRWQRPSTPTTISRSSPCDTSKTSIGGGFKVGDLIAFGADGSCTRKESDVRNARYLTPDGWREWVSCAG